MRGIIWGAACVTLASACVGESGEGRRDTVDGATDTLVIDTASDTASDASDTSDDPIAVVSFAADLGTITHGVDARGVEIAGAATLTWRTRGATDVAILVDGIAISLAGCVPSGGGPCAEAGGLVVRPATTTTFVLEARGPDGRCEGPCPTATVTVAVAAPAIVTLEAGAPVVSAGGDASAAYSASAASFSIGLTGFDDEGARTFDPCVPVSIADASAPCLVSDDGQGRVLDVGIVTVRGVERDVTFAAVAENGADDGLGDVALGDVLAGVIVPVEVIGFGATPAKVLPGASVVLAWEVRGAHVLAVTSDSDDVVGLATCVGFGEDGQGFCTVTIDPDAALGEVAFELVGTQDSGAQGKARATVEVIGGPRFTAAAASPQVVVPGQPVTLTYEAFGADDVALDAQPDAVDASCEGPDDNGAGRCELVVRAGTPAGSIALTLTASHTNVGPPAIALVELGVLAAPEVEAFEIDDVTVVASARLGLSWVAADAAFVELTEDSGAIAPAALGACSAVSGADGAGGCLIALPVGLDAGSVTFELTAVGATGARSIPATRVVTIGEPPTATLTASPTLLPEGGGEVTLTWTAPTASHVVVTDDALVPDTIVDTGEGTICVDASPCAPAGDSIELEVVQPSVFTLVATNDFGSEVVTASVSLEGAPVIAALTLDGADALGASLLVAGAEAALSWQVDHLDASDALRLERAPLPAPNGPCVAVAPTAWLPAAGFPRAGAGTGTVTLGGLTATAECFRFTAEDLGATPSQRTSALFKVKKAPAITSLTVDDATVQPGDAVTVSWSTTHAYGVTLTASPVGAVTSQDLGGCVAATGSCTVVMQPGTPLGDVTFSLVARGEEGAETAPRALPVTLGAGARLDAFTVSPGSATSATDVTLAWTTRDGASLVIGDGATNVSSTTDLTTIASGTLVVRASATTTWTLTVANAFGSATGQVTVFIGPSIDLLTANGGNAKDGAESVITGPVTIAWTTTSASGSHRLQRVKAPGDGNCAAAGLQWATVYEDLAAPPASASHPLGTVTENTCVRLVVTNTEVPPQSSTATFLLRELPAITTLATSPGTLPSSGGTVIIDIGARGASALSLTAQYRAADGSVLGTRAVCDQASLNAGSLDGGADVDDVECAHVIVPCNLLCLNNGMPSGTKTVRYVLAIGDAEGDTASATTSGGAGGEDVTLP